jgi:RNA polymerase sigma factor (sigma-70 family)
LPPDDELVEEMLNGSKAAMDVLVRRHYKNIFSYVYRKTGNYHLAYDLTQEIFIKMMKSIKNYKHQGKFSRWLLKIAVNHCRDYYKSSDFRKEGQRTELPEELAQDSSNVWDIFQRKQQRKEVRESINALPEYQREAIILRFYHDLKIKEIALITGSKEPTVKSRLRQGLEKLKNMLNGGEHCERTGSRF